MSIAQRKDAPRERPAPAQEEIDFHVARCTDESAKPIDVARSSAWLNSHGLPHLIPIDPEPEPENPTRAIDQDAELPWTQGLPAKAKPGERSDANVDAERFVLAGMLTGAEQTREAAELLSGDEFVLRVHQVIFREVIDRRSTDKSIDRVVLTEAIVGAGFSRDTAASALLQITSLSAPDSIAEQAGIVGECAYRRRTAETLGSVLETVASGKAPREVLARLIEEKVAPLGSIEQISRWDSPSLEDLASVPEFPVDVYPPPLADMIRQHAAMMPCPADFIAASVLAVASVGIGKTRAIRIKSSWVENANLFLALVSPPGTKKSPAMMVAARPVWDAHDELLRDHRRECDRIRDRNDGRKKGHAEDFPDPERLVFCDTTREQVAHVLPTSPRGFLVFRDELSGWLNGMDQYKRNGGDDEQFWLSLHNCSPVLVDRKGQEDGLPTYERQPFVSVMGALTPSRLRSFSLGSDGFTERMLFSFPPRIPNAWVPKDPDASLKRAWKTAFFRLWRRVLIRDDWGNCLTLQVGFDASGKKAWEAFMGRHIKETQQSDFDPDYHGAWAKLEAQCARLALIVDQINWAYGGADDAQKDISAKSVESAERLIDYFKAHFRKVTLSVKGAEPDNAHARAILKWAVTRAEETQSEGDGRHRVSMRDIKANFKRLYGPTEPGQEPGMMLDALNWLVDRHCFREVSAARKPGPGRSPKSVYEINPALLKKS